MEAADAHRRHLGREPDLLERTLASPAAAHELLRAGAGLTQSASLFVTAVAVPGRSRWPSSRSRPTCARPPTSRSGWGRGSVLPLLGGDDLRELLDDGRRRRLPGGAAGLVHPRPRAGPSARQTPRGWRRQRFSELDPVRLAFDARRSARVADLACSTGGSGTCRCSWRASSRTTRPRAPSARSSCSAWGGRWPSPARPARCWARRSRPAAASGCSTSSGRAGTASRRTRHPRPAR